MAFVRIAHPDVEGTALVGERAFRALQAKGWRLADQPATEPTEPVVVPITDLPPVQPASDTPIADAVTAALSAAPSTPDPGAPTP